MFLFFHVCVTWSEGFLLLRKICGKTQMAFDLITVNCTQWLLHFVLLLNMIFTPLDGLMISKCKLKNMQTIKTCFWQFQIIINSQSFMSEWLNWVVLIFQYDNKDTRVCYLRLNGAYNSLHGRCCLVVLYPSESLQPSTTAFTCVNSFMFCAHLSKFSKVHKGKILSRLISTHVHPDQVN